MKRLKWALYILAALLVLIQFYQPDITPRTTDTANSDLLRTIPGAPSYLRGACYDCHSNESKLPWYGYVNPVGILVRNHIIEARKHLNFSVIQDYPTEKKVKKLNECAEEIRDGEMPLQSYTWMHHDAQLSDEQRNELSHWFETAAAAALARDMNNQ
ncbi:MAG: heme-binding domain-containing protein [Saprospiraceae bacterium]|nr:heme-binding domain-containing protein [Saprospiraceae bacterium]